jgi:hypothetical protein
MQWPDLAQYLDTENRTIATAIAHTPLTVDAYITKRFEIFFKCFLTPYFGITDHWYRYEWQHRGSLHVHGLAWLDDCPDTRNCTEAEVVQHWDRYVSTWNPAMEQNDNPVDFFWRVDTHPCTIPCQDVDNLSQDIKNLVNICQKHTRCTPGYCLRVQPDGQQKCRFGFPKELNNNTVVTFTNDAQGNRNGVEIKPAANDPLINKYNRHCLSTWRANMDVSITYEMSDVAKYIAKYASKAEKTTHDYNEIFRHIVTDQLAPQANLQRAANALLMQTIGNADICAQQAAHIMSSLPLTSCSRHFVSCHIDGEHIHDNAVLCKKIGRASCRERV